MMSTVIGINETFEDRIARKIDGFDKLSTDPRAVFGSFVDKKQEDVTVAELFGYLMGFFYDVPIDILSKRITDFEEEEDMWKGMFDPIMHLANNGDFVVYSKEKNPE